MGKTQSKPLAARHGRGTTWSRHGNGILCVNWPLLCYDFRHILAQHILAKFMLNKCVEDPQCLSQYSDWDMGYVTEKLWFRFRQGREIYFFFEPSTLAHTFGYMELIP